MQIFLGGTEYKSQKAAKEKYKQICGELGKGAKIYPDHECFDFFADLAKRHPFAADRFYGGGGVDFFMLGSNPQHNDIEPQIWRKDGSNVPLKVSECLSGKRTKKDKLQEACRRAIVDQIFEFKNRVPMPELCPACGKSGKMHVDHHPTPFIQIFGEFVSGYGRCENLVDNSDYSTTFAEDCEETMDYNAKWQDFHMELAEYQWLCASCNSSKGAKGASW